MLRLSIKRKFVKEDKDDLDELSSHKEDDDKKREHKQDEGEDAALEARLKNSKTELQKQVAPELMIMLRRFVGAWRYIMREQRHSFRIMREKGCYEVWMA